MISEPKKSHDLHLLAKSAGSSRERRKEGARIAWLQREEEGIQGSRVVLRGVGRGGISQPVKVCRKTNKAFSRA